MKINLGRLRFLISFSIALFSLAALARPQKSPGIEANEKPHITVSSVEEYLTGFLQAPEYSVFFNDWNSPKQSSEIIGAVQLSRQMVKPSTSTAPYFLDYVGFFEQEKTESQMSLAQARYVTHNEKAAQTSDPTGVYQPNREIFTQELIKPAALLGPTLEIMQFALAKIKEHMVTTNYITYPSVPSYKKVPNPLGRAQRDRLREPYLASAYLIRTVQGYSINLVLENSFFQQVYYEPSGPKLLVTYNPAFLFTQRVGVYSQIKDQYQAAIPHINQYTSAEEIKAVLENPDLQLVIRNFVNHLDLQMSDPSQHTSHCAESLLLKN